MPNIQTLNKNILSEKNEIISLLLLWSLFQLLSYFHFGIQTPIDSTMYIENAQAILAGHWPQGRDFFYTSYSQVIALAQMLRIGQNGVIALQIVASGFALICIYRMIQKISNHQFAPLIAGLLYIFWFKFQQWNLILYTDALFTSMVVISVYLLHSSKSKWGYSIALLVLLFTALIRPTGIGLLLAVVVYFLFDKLNFYRKNLALHVSILIFVLAGSIFILNGLLSHFVDSFIASYHKAEIIYPHITLGMTCPDQLYLPDKKDPALIQLGTFFVENWSYMIRLSAIKGGLYLAHIKPYYSVGHNLFIALFLYPVYFFAIQGFKYYYRTRLCIFVFTFVLLQVLTISFTSENWDGRFLLPILPWVFMLAALGFSRLLSKKVNV